MTSTVTKQVKEPEQQSNPVPLEARLNHLRSLKAFKEARREWHKLCDRRLAMVNQVLDVDGHVEFDRIVGRMDELAKQIVRSSYGVRLGFDRKLDVAVFKGRFVFEHYDRLGTIPARGAWYLALELYVIGDLRKRRA